MQVWRGTLPPYPRWGATWGTGWTVGFVALLLGIQSVAVHAFDNLTEAQTLVYDTPHLANTTKGQSIDYTYTSKIPDGRTTKDVTDKVTLSVLDTVEDKRDVSVAFLTGVNKLPLPDFKAYRGNPVIIAMLEYVAVSMSRDTGGGTLYFRNRIKDGLAAKDMQIETISTEYSDKTVKAQKFSFSPFAGDSFLVERPQYTGCVFTFTLSDEVPGGVLLLDVSSSQQASADAFHYKLALN